MIVVQAEAGAATAGNGDGATGFDGIADSGRQALSELRRLLGVLRAEGEPTALSPQPGVEDLGELVGQLQSAGLPAELRVEGPVRPLPAAVSLSAYRIVQEALTNVVRHAGPARAMVRVRYDADTIDLEVADDGVGATWMTDGGARHGLVGIRERVEIFGGRLEAGPRPGGGFAVRAWLPTRG